MQNRPENSGQFERDGKSAVVAWLAALAAILIILMFVGVCLNFFAAAPMDDQPIGQIAGTAFTDGSGQGEGDDGLGLGSTDGGSGDQPGPMGSPDGIADAALHHQPDETELAESAAPETQPAGISRIDLDSAKPTRLGLVDETVENPQPEVPALAGKVSSTVPKGTANPALKGKSSPKSIFHDEQAALAKRIVYIIDSSGSMKDGRLDLAKKELINSLKTLKKPQEFYVVFFSSSAMEMPSGKMQLAVPYNRKKAENWMKKIKPDGATRVANAMEIAVSKKPDMIWLLTDGEIADPLKAQKILDDYRRKNPKLKFRLNTIAFIEPKGERLLKHLAKKYGGSYKFVAK